jgi:glycosyltransferase involved in cell wall biosynthesis
MANKPSILLLSWRDYYNPKKGGAEVLDYEIFKRLVKKGYKITWFAPMFENAAAEENIDGISYKRFGTFFGIHKNAINFYKKHKSEYDIIIDEYHGYPFFTNMYVDKPKFTIIHEVAGDIWFKMFKFPVSYVGFTLEKIFFKLLKNHQFVTVSNSTKKDILKQGIKENNISIISEGTNVEPVQDLDYKKNLNQICFVGRICKMKGVTDLLESFSYVLKEIPDAKLILVGKIDPAYKPELDNIIENHNLQEHVLITGFVSEEDKIRHMKESQFIASCSMKEGWGLIITEANVLGTPAITYNVAGFCDAIDNGKSGFLTEENNPESMGREIVARLKDQGNYKKLQKDAYEWSKQFSWDTSAEQMEKLIADAIKNQRVKKPNVFKRLFVNTLFTSLMLAGKILNK